MHHVHIRVGHVHGPAYPCLKIIDCSNHKIVYLNLQLSPDSIPQQEYKSFITGLCPSRPRYNSCNITLLMFALRVTYPKPDLINLHRVGCASKLPCCGGVHQSFRIRIFKLPRWQLSEICAILIYFFWVSTPFRRRTVSGDMRKRWRVCRGKDEIWDEHATPTRYQCCSVPQIYDWIVVSRARSLTAALWYFEISHAPQLFLESGWRSLGSSPESVYGQPPSNLLPLCCWLYN